MPGPGRKRSDARRLRQAQRLHLRARRSELLLAEPAPHFPDVDEAFLLLHRDMDRPEAGPRSFRLGEPDHREIADAVGADLLPIPEAAAAVRGLRPLRHHPLEPQLAPAGVERTAL